MRDSYDEEKLEEFKFLLTHYDKALQIKIKTISNYPN